VLPRRLVGFLIASLICVSAPLAAQDASDIIRGRVIGTDKAPIENVSVTATSLVNQTSRTAKTNKDGRFTIIFSGGGGDYMMSLTLIGYQMTRFEVRREADEDILIADGQLSKSAVILDAVRVQANRARVGRNDNGPEIGARDQTLNTGNVPIDKLGDLAAMAATLPGVTLIPGADGVAAGFSVLGLGADQNNITLNGMNFSGTDLPRDATTATRVTTSSFDPSRGGFSGAQIALRTNSGTNYFVRSLHTTVDAPSLQYTDPVGRQLGQQFTNLQLSGVASGPITFDKAFYNFSFQLGKRMSDLQTLLNTDPLALERVGVSADSAAKLITALSGLGIPASSLAIPSSRLTRNGSFLTNFDFAPTGTHSVTVTANGRWSGVGGSNLSTTAVPTHGGDNDSWGGTLQARHSSYFGNGFLDETNASFQLSETNGDPYLVLPDARVRVNSDFPDGTAGVSTLQFGGNSSLPRSSTTRGAQLSNQISWISLNNKHRFKLVTDARYNSFAQDNTTNRLGTFTYNSLSDFENGVAASFSRRLLPRRREGDELGFSIALGDSYRRTQRFQVTYGLRVDAAQFQGSPKFNAVVDSAFGVRNDAVPRGVYVSPRLGFSWTYGTSAQIGGFDGAARGSRGTLRGGVGQFQNLPNSNLIAGAVDNTGLPDAAQQLTCIGSAVPAALWSQFLRNPGSIPSACLDGSSAFSSTVPNVSLFDANYIPQRSWRANLGWNAPILSNHFRASLDGTYSLNLQQQGTIDLNFDRVRRFSLSDEGGRPVFVNPASIVPLTGSIISRDARVDQSFAQITDYRSDLQSRSAQVSIGISPVRFNSALQWNATYVWQKVVDLSRGFNGTTAGDPYLTQWARSSSDARHQFNYTINYTFKNAVSFAAFGRVQSGNPFTPVVSGDINGDGYGNDRAYIYDPSTARDPTLASAMQSLLADAPGSVRACLTKQLGTVAGRNSCEGPWSTSLSARVSIMSDALKLPQRATISLGIANPLTGVDALVHGSNNLHGWGTSQFVDPTLLYVRGFDATTQAYKYDVNPRFGASRQGTAVSRAPMQITLDVRVDVGPERGRQELNLQLRSGRTGKGQKLSEQALRQRYTRSYPNPFEQMLRQHDSLGLSDEVSDSIAILNKNYGRVIDSIWTPIAKYLASLPNEYDLGAAYDRVSAAENKSLDQMAIFGPAAKKLLTDTQIRMLPPYIALFLDQKAIRNVRPGSFGRGPGAFGGGGGGGGRGGGGRGGGG
jgi:Carboxypeptidase regulatory-like domain